jgi:hypothetical protein
MKQTLTKGLLFEDGGEGVAWGSEESTQASVHWRWWLGGVPMKKISLILSVGPVSWSSPYITQVYNREFGLPMIRSRRRRSYFECQQQPDWLNTRGLHDGDCSKNEVTKWWALKRYNRGKRGLEEAVSHLYKLTFCAEVSSFTQPCSTSSSSPYSPLNGLGFASSYGDAEDVSHGHGVDNHTTSGLLPCHGTPRIRLALHQAGVSAK